MKDFMNEVIVPLGTNTKDEKEKEEKEGT